MDRNKELIRNTVILGAGTLIPKVFSLVILPILTTYLTTVEYGNFDLVNSIVSFVAVSYTHLWLTAKNPTVWKMQCAIFSGFRMK